VVIRAKAPLRVSFAGGGTDIAPFPQTEGGVVLSATINRYTYGSLSPRDDGQIRLASADFGLSLGFPMSQGAMFDGKLDLIKAAVRRFGGKEMAGYELALHADAPPGSGLGSSSTTSVVLVGLLREHYGLLLSEYETAQLAHDIERIDAGILGGMQDHYAATFGGFNYIEFGDHLVIVNQITVRPEVVSELERSLLLCYTGTTRESATIIADQTARLADGEVATLSGLRAQKEVAMAMKSALLRGELHEFGELLGEAWREKKRMSPMISTPHIEEAFELARHNGARGGKVTGAGGGGFILFYCDFLRKQQLAAALTDFGATVSEVSFESHGLMTWRSDDEIYHRVPRP
jgi:D-glycero-alpha-D-manno-heptose-7-phosphate kinase